MSIQRRRTPAWVGQFFSDRGVVEHWSYTLVSWGRFCLVIEHDDKSKR